MTAVLNQKENKCFDALKSHFSDSLQHYMEENDVGFNEMKKRLGTSSVQLSKILKKEANLTIKMASKIYALVGEPDFLGID